jgi:putative lipoprotein
VAGLAVGCRSTQAATPAPSLIGTSWRAEEIDGRGVLERPESTLSFENAQRIAGHTACNRYFGGLELGDGTIRLKPAGTTRMACPPAVMDQESRFLAALGAATGFRAEGGKLLLLDEGGRVRVRLAALTR